jgi:glycosyltransferase 2 family protein
MSNPEDRHFPLKLMIGLLLIPAAIVWLWSVPAVRSWNFSAFVDAFRSVDPVGSTLAVVIALGSYLWRAVRWRALVLPIQPEAKLRRIFFATEIGFAAVVILGRAGELVRPYLIARTERVSVASQISTWLVERLLDTIALTLIFGFVLLNLNSTVAKIEPQTRFALQTGGLTLFAVAVAGIFVLATLHLTHQRVANWLEGKRTILPSRFAQWAKKFFHSLEQASTAIRSRGVWQKLVWYTLGEWFLIVAGTLVLVRAFPPTAGLGWWDAAFLVATVALGSLISVPGIGGGSQAATIAVLSIFYGVSISQSTLFATLIWLVNLLVVVPPAVVGLPFLGIGLREALRIGETGK